MHDSIIISDLIVFLCGLVCTFIVPTAAKDYTLAQYRPEFDLLAYEGATEKLVAMGYPSEIRGYCYDPGRFSRGLVLDKVRGNIVKMDR